MICLEEGIKHSKEGTVAGYEQFLLISKMFTEGFFLKLLTRYHTM